MGRKFHINKNKPVNIKFASDFKHINCKASEHIVQNTSKHECCRMYAQRMNYPGQNT
jgi:hypothetical protein